MKKITLFLFSLLFCWSVNAQIGIIEGLNSTTLPAGWSDPSGFDFGNTTTGQCEGTHAWRHNSYSGNTAAQLITNNLVAASNGTDVTVNFQWKATEYSAASGVGYTVNAQYSTDNGANWINVGDPIVATTISECAAFSAVIPGASVPVGSDFKFRFNVVWTAGDSYFWVDNISITQVTTAPPVCTTMTNPANGAVDVLSTVISWAGANGIPSGYKLTVGTTPAGSELLNMLDVGLVTSHDLGFLESSTVYYVTVVPYNSNGDAVGCTASSFTTCGPIATLPWTEGFEGLATVGANSFPGCWVKENGEWQTYEGATTWNTPRTGTKYLREVYGATNEYIWTKGFALTGGTSYDFSTFVQGDNGTTWVVDMFVHDAPNSSGATMIGDPYAVPGTGGSYFAQNYVEMRRTFVPGSTGTYYFGIRVNVDFAPYYLAFDDFRLEVTPTCQAPVDLDVANITTNAADFTWQNIGSESAWDVVIGGSGDTDPAALTIIDKIDTFHSFALQPNTVYKVWVRADCGAGSYSAWSGPFTFKTMCTGVTDFYQSFDAGTTMPDCWARVGTGGAVSILASTAALSAPNVLVLNGYSATSRGMITTAAVSNAAAGTHRLKFSARASYSWNVGAQIEVGYLAVANDADSFVLVETFTTTSATAYDTFVTEFPNTTETGYLALRHSGAPAYTETYIDNVIWEILPTTAPGCAVATATPDANCGNYDNLISWAPVSGADGYYLSLGTTPGGVDLLNSEDIGNSLSYTFSGNYASTYYYTVVPFNVVGSATGCVEQSFVTVATGCYCVSLPSNNDGLGITNVQLGNTDFPNTDVTYFDHTATAVDLPQGVTANLQVTFATGYDYDTNVWIDFNNDFNFDETEIVFDGMSTALNPTTLNASFIMPATAALGVHTMRIATADSGQAIPDPCYDGFYGVTLDFKVNILPAPSCVPPTAVSVDGASISASSATVNWVASFSNPTNGYQYYRDTTNTPPTGTTTPTGTVGQGVITANLTGLDPATTYYVWVRSNCGTDDFSDWAAAAQPFTTLCLATNLPYVMDFESAVVPAMPGCSVRENAGTGNNWITSSNPGNGFTTKVLRYNYSGANAANAWFFTQGLNLETGKTYSVSFDYGTNSTFYAEDLKVMLGSSAASAAMTLEIENIEGFNNDSPLTATATFTVSANGVYYMGFNVYSIANQYNVYVDDIEVTEVLSNDDFSTASFTAYPNPVKDVLNLSYSQNISDVAVFNLLGQQVVTKTVNAAQGQIDMSNLAAGTYLVKVTTDNLVKTIKVIKE